MYDKIAIQELRVMFRYACSLFNMQHVSKTFLKRIGESKSKAYGQSKVALYIGLVKQLLKSWYEGEAIWKVVSLQPSVPPSMSHLNLQHKVY